MREHIGYHLIKPRYYDQPEGKDLFGKLVITNAYMGTVGVIWSTYDVLMLTKPQGYFNTFSRYAYHTGPFMGMATAFTLTTYLANKFRGKDDTYVKHCLIFRLVICGIIVFFFFRWNYTAGACAAGAVLGAWKRNVVLGSVGALIFSKKIKLTYCAIIHSYSFFF